VHQLGGLSPIAQRLLQLASGRIPPLDERDRPRQRADVARLKLLR
jgi:hypothetical protein